MHPKGHTARINHVNLYYETYGQGHPLILLHGGTVSSNCWHEQIEVFSYQYRLILVDTRGHGRSTDSNQPFSYSLMASDIVQLLEHLEIKSAHLCGWSDGGVIGLHLGIHHPGLITKQILIGANFHVDGLVPDFRNWLKHPVESDVSGCWSPEIEASYKNLSPQGPASWESFFKKIITLWREYPQYPEKEIAKILTPTLLVVGDREQFIQLGHTLRLFELLRFGELCILPNTDHRVFQRRSDVFNNIALEFFQREEIRI